MQGTATLKQQIQSSNLDKALKSILSENPRSKQLRNVVVSPEHSYTEGMESVASSRDHIASSTPSSRTPSQSRSPGHIPRETDLHPFVAIFEQAHENGSITNDLRAEAIALIRQNYSEWVRVNRHLNILKRKIKQLQNPNTETESPSKGPKKVKKRRGRPPGVGSPKKIVTGPETTVAVEEASKAPQEQQQQMTSGSGHGKSDLTGTGPNGLTGSYWDIPVEQMGRGARRKSKT